MAKNGEFTELLGTLHVCGKPLTCVACQPSEREEILIAALRYLSKADAPLWTLEVVRATARMALKDAGVGHEDGERT